MGMFDYVKVDINKLPLTEEEKQKYGSKFSFQSKDWECKLSELTITETGELEYRNFDYGWDDNAPIGAFGLQQGLTEENVRIEKISLHGYLNFGDYKDGKHFDFAAKFTDGKLVEIIRVS